MSSQVIAPNTEASVLGRLMQAREGMSRDVAEYLLSIDFAGDDTERMNVLAERAREGNLTPEEATELDSYLHVGSMSGAFSRSFSLRLGVFSNPKFPIHPISEPTSGSRDLAARRQSS
jgi:hypothetical protein